MSEVSNLTTLVRYLIQDFSTNQIPGDLFTYSTSNIFTLSEPNALSIITVKKNSSILTSSQYSYNSTTQAVTVTAFLAVNDIVEIQYSYYSNYSDTELEIYIRSAVIYLSLHNYFTFIVDSSNNFNPTLTNSERNLVSMVASILIKPDNQTIRLPDMTINVPQSLPTRDLIAKAICIFKQNSSGEFDIMNPSQIGGAY